MSSSSLNLGFGVTVWRNGYYRQQWDGIGIYTQALYSHLSTTIAITPMALGKTPTSFPLKQTLSLGRRLSNDVCTVLNYAKTINAPLHLFHATDHVIPKLKKIPVIATIMDIIPLLHPEWSSAKSRSFKNFRFKKGILSADHVITISEYSREDLIEHLKIAPERISITPLGVDQHYFVKQTTEIIDRVLKEHQLRPGFFLFVGTLQPRKNLETLIASHEQLSPVLRKEHPLVIVGRSGWRDEHLIMKIHQLERFGYVKWLRYLPKTDVFVLLQSALALAFVSLYEGFGLPIIEAFAAGCPVIASNSTSLPEVVGKAGLLVNPNRAEEIRAAMETIIHHADVRERCKVEGLQRAKEYTWEACAAATMAAYQKVV